MEIKNPNNSLRSTGRTDRVSIVTPTRNRSKLLEKLLCYYSCNGFAGNIYIGDASDTPLDTENLVNRYRGTLRCFLVHGRLDPLQAVAKLLPLVTTPYVVVSADDDFLLVSALERCIQFLDGHLDCSSVGGRALLARQNSTGKVTGLLEYKLPKILDEDPITRLMSLFSCYRCPAFGVFRTSVKIYTYKYINGNYDPKSSLECELIPSALVALVGRIGQIDELLMVRTFAPERAKSPTLIEMITDPNWTKDYQHFVAVLSREVGPSLAKQAIDCYLSGVLATKARNTAYQPRLIRRLVRKIPGAIGWYENVQARKTAGKDWPEVQRIVRLVESLVDG